jgi:WXG100 family type VII secretion target
MALIQVTSAKLRAEAEKLKTYNGNFKNQVNSLESLEGELNSMWEGDAKVAFHTSFQSDKVQMDNFYNAIEKYIQSLLVIAAKYEQAESTNTETAKSRNYK